MACMRAICGRLKSDYRYSKDIVYNNFPQCTLSDTQKAKIEQSARAILDTRKLFPESSLSNLYDSLTMPIELKKAHEENNKEVMKAYGFKNSMNDDEIATELMKMYQHLIKQNHQKNCIKQ